MLPLEHVTIGLPECPEHPERPYYTAVLVAVGPDNSQWVLGSKLISFNDLRGLERSGSCIIKRHFKCPRLLYVLMN
jgi:hypothetical protein